MMQTTTVHADNLLHDGSNAESLRIGDEMYLVGSYGNCASAEKRGKPFSRRVRITSTRCGYQGPVIDSGSPNFQAAVNAAGRIFLRGKVGTDATDGPIQLSTLRRTPLGEVVDW